MSTHRHVTGKQLPSSVCTRLEMDTDEDGGDDDDYESSLDGNIDTAVPSDESQWRLYDAAISLQRDRQDLIRNDQGDSDDDSSHSESKRRPMKLSTHFLGASMVERLQQKDEIIRQAFQEAAMAVVQAIQRTSEPLASKESGNSSTVWKHNLPLILRPSTTTDKAAHQRTFEEARSYCFERSYENKEYTKRKGGKTEVHPTVTATRGPQHPVQARLKPTPKRQPKPKAAPKVASVATTAILTSPVTSSAVAASAAAAMSGGGTIKLLMSPVTSQGSSGTGTTAPKFTRNTPASSAAALDQRYNTSRAILCVAGNIVFDRLTPNALGDDDTSLNVLDVPQAKTPATPPNDPDSVSKVKSETGFNMGAVLIEAQTLGQRTISIVDNAVRRAKLRYQYRQDNIRYSNANDSREDNIILRVNNPWSLLHQQEDSEDDSDDPDEKQQSQSSCEPTPYQPNPDAITFTWQSTCLPRFLTILDTGAGHAVYHDSDWSSRHGRIADLFRSLSTSNSSGSVSENFGPHLIVTTEPEVRRFAQEFLNVQTSLRLIMSRRDAKSLRALSYGGTKKQRRKLRRYFSQASGLPEAPFHVLITSYKSFLADYLHFCQVPFEAVVLDEGCAWMATKDLSSLGSIWDSAIFSSNDHNVGLAGTSFKEWEFMKDSMPDTVVKEAWVGLTCRHRIATASTFVMKQRATQELLPVSAILDFVAPQFSAVVKEEWDRSKICSSSASMTHFRKLVARSVVVHSPESPNKEMNSLALLALSGELAPPDRSDDLAVPVVVSDDEFVSTGKIASSRRSTLQWLGAPNQSWLRYELGRASFQPILDATKLSVNHGHFCEEVTTASSITASGATGQISGTMAYRLAIRCGRHFGSEPGLRQHLSAQHAPPATWLCRTCFSDCITSQARTHHERNCGQPINGLTEDPTALVDIAQTAGRGGAKKTGVGKKKMNRQGAAQGGDVSTQEKSLDGSFRVPGYRGVWVNKTGKHFIMVEGRQWKQDDSIAFFDSTDDAARKYDEIVQTRQENQNLELNFKPDGSRVVYEDLSSAASGLGGSAASVVPALSVINIKDLPPDVKPLLRDPRQTSRTGGNSKRHIYAYRGVCRQARKGHDRWQAQISFMGVNHYLGTFDSEWDAAAIYAWAHLILYGEEATRLAQKEGEEAAAAYEQEKRDIADGKVPETVQKQDKKKKTPVRKPKGRSADSEAGGDAEIDPDGQNKRRAGSPCENVVKKARTTKDPTSEKEMIASVLAKCVAKAPLLAPRAEFEQTNDGGLLLIASRRLKLSRAAAYCNSGTDCAVSGAPEYLRPCLVEMVKPSSGGAMLGKVKPTLGGAMLCGLSPSPFGWDLQSFVESCKLGSEQDAMAALQLLAVEYDDDGVNDRFRSIIQGTVCIIGAAGKETQHAYNYIGLGSVPVGGSVGNLDCHIGGVPGSCSERAACIRYSRSGTSPFQFSCISDEDIVTLNGRRIAFNAGPFPLFDEDICSVGARVFVFIIPKDYT